MTTAIPHPTARRGLPPAKTKFLVGGVVIVLAIVALIVNGVQTAGNYYITLPELVARGEGAIGQGIRVNAAVDKESVRYDTQNIVLAFDLVDPESGLRQAVVYRDVMPDLFMKSESVIVEGRLGEGRVLEASTMLVKCPSKYEEALQQGEQLPADHLNTN